MLLPSLEGIPAANMDQTTLFNTLLLIIADEVSRVKQVTPTLPEHLVPHPLQGALNCIGCSLA